MIALVRASRSEVVAALTDGGAGAVSPTNGSGWTAVQAPDVGPLRPLGDLFAVEEHDGELTLHTVLDGAASTWTWDPEEPGNLDDAARTMARVLGRPERYRGLRRILHEAFTAEEIVDEIRQRHDGLPSPWGPVPRTEVTLQHGDPAAARLAGRIASASLDAVRLAVLPDGWTLLRGETGPDAQGIVTAAVAAGSRRRRASILTLWRGEDLAAGFELWRGPEVVARGHWHTGWRDLEDDEHEARDADAAEVAGPFTDADPVRLRALLRARTWSDDPLVELVSLLGVPPEALEILDGRAGSPELEPLEPAPAWRLIGDTLKELRSEPMVASRRLQILLAGVALVLGLGSLFLAVTWYVVLGTDGALVDQDGVTAGDWAFAAVLTVAAPMNLWCAARMYRHGSYF